jgi:hypothetical protein
VRRIQSAKVRDSCHRCLSECDCNTRAYWHSRNPREAFVKVDDVFESLRAKKNKEEDPGRAFIWYDGVGQVRGF